MDFSFIFKDDVKITKDGDKEAPIDSETVNNPMEPIRIEERIKKKKKKKEKKIRPPTKLLIPPSPGHRVCSLTNDQAIFGHLSQTNYQ